MALADNDRQELEKISRSRTESASHVQRATLLLMYASESSITAITKQISTTRLLIEFYYPWLRPKPSRRFREDGHLKVTVEIACVAHKRTLKSYGARRLQPKLAADGFFAGRELTSRLPRELHWLSTKAKIQDNHGFQTPSFNSW
ncbi:MAG: hypothetical protein ACK5PS_05770 [Desulfopila sp.]